MEHNTGYALAVLTAMIIHCCNGKEQVRMILLDYNQFQSEVDSNYQCRMSPPVDDPNDVTVESLRTGWTRDTVEENPHPPDAYFDTSVSHPPYRVDMLNNGNNDAFGVFGCNATEDGKIETIISTTRMRSDADIVPSNGLFSQTVSTGDTNVTIGMMRTTGLPLESLRWRNNTFLWGNPHLGVENFIIGEPIQLYHTGIYECHRAGDRASAKHGLNLLIVRACPSTRWGPPDCEGVCDSCYNGGICNEDTGKCVCAPGFRGKNCLTACGGNRYGYDCEQRCTYKGLDPKDNCMGTLFCLVHPFGCRCNTGFGGLDCDADCDVNSFGASCLQSCHCASDECNRYTGECVGTDTTCDPGWTGEFCQECVNGYFGSTCDQECHCTSDKCNRESGLCQTGGCLPQWTDLFPPFSCQTGLIRATYERVNPNITIPVNCTAVQGPGGNLTYLDVVLSRSSDDFDKSDISLEDTFLKETTVTRLFAIRGVDEDIDLYCLLHDESDVTVALLTVSIDLYELPVLTNAPLKENTTYSSVTIIWSAWDTNTDAGDPPIVGYVPYYKKQEDDSWMQGGKVSATASLRFTFNDLDSGVDYSFAVATVREGNGGEGPRSPSLHVKITCAVPPSPKNVVTNMLGERQQLVEISWELPYEGIRCSSGVLKFTVYYYSSSSAEKTKEDVIDPTANSAILYNLTVGVSYTFFVTLSTSGGESEGSNEVQHLVPVLPSFADPPTLIHVTCNSVTMIWGKWTQSNDPGTPPILHYIPYHRVNVSFNWISGDIYNHSEIIENYEHTFHDLAADSIYEFCVVVVREGFGGEGDKNGIERQSTAYCLDSPEDHTVPIYVITILVVILAVLIIVATVICLKRYREGQPETYAVEGPTVVNYENAGFGCPDNYASIGENHVTNCRSGHQDESLKQQYENTEFSGYETAITNIHSMKRITESEENPYEIAVL